MKALVTGGAGFIGSHTVEKLLEEGYEVIIVDNLATGQFENINKDATFYPSDIRSKELDIIFKIEKPDIVVHLAAQTSVQNSIIDPTYDCSENILGTVNLLQSCNKHDVKKLIFASTAAVYGVPQKSPIKECHRLSPESFYGLSKLCSEQYIQNFGNLYDFNYTILRYSNVYGPKQNITGEAGVITIFINQIIKNEPLIIYGDGKQSRDFIYVEDVADANIAAIKKGDNQIYNISNNVLTSIQSLATSLMYFTNAHNKCKYQENRPGDIIESRLSNHKALDALNWQPKVQLEEGLTKTYNYFKNQKNIFD